jgi:putative ABC transport system permease protein
VILAGLRVRKMRLMLTAVAISLGVAFVVGTITLTDTLEAQLYAATARQARDVAVRVSADEPTLTDADLATLRALPGVASAVEVGSADGVLLSADGRVIDTFGTGTSTLRTAATDQRLAGFDLDAGSYPAGPGEAVVDRETALAQGWQPGSVIRLVTKDDEIVPLRLAGTADVRGGLPTVYLVPEDYKTITGERAWAAIHLRAQPGVDQGELRAAVADALRGRPVSVITGAAYTDQLVSGALTDVDTIRAGLGAFALVALLVSAMVIHNTFTILVAQRRQEIALLRCAGARRGQVFRMVLVEAVATGSLATLIGFGLGTGFGWLGAKALGRFSGIGLDVPVQVGWVAPCAAAAVGVGMTVATALAPAVGATRVSPIAALATSPDLVGSRRASVLRVLLGVAGVLLGATLVVAGAAGQQPLLAVAGALPTLLGAIAVGPVLVGPLGRLVGRLPAALLGVPGRLAAASPDRNPRRTAATALALTVGITLVNAFLVSAESLKETIAFQMRKQFPVDYLVAAPDGHHLPADLADRLVALPEVDRVSAVASVEATVSHAGRDVSADVGGVEPDVIRRDFGLAANSGAIDNFAPGRALVSQPRARALAVRAGDRITVSGPAGSVEVAVAAVVAGGTAPLPEVLLAPTDANAALGPLAPSLLLVWVGDGVPAIDARTAIDAVTDTVPLATVGDLQAAGDEMAGIVDGLLMIVGILIVLSVLIAVVGITNTLILSVLDRVREFGLLRAIGLSRTQLRTMLLAEGIILALIATASGVALGIGLGVAGAYATLPHEWLIVSLPYARIALVALGAAAVGLIAAVVPARRAARVTPVAALTAD